MTTFNFDSDEILYVTTVEDQNDGSDRNGMSLRDAILTANANPGRNYTIYIVKDLLADTDSITFNLTRKNVIIPPTVDDQFIDLPTLIESRRFTGDLDITGNVTIVGATFNPDNPPSPIPDGATQAELKDLINPTENLVAENPENIVIDAFGLLGDFRDPVGRRVGDRIFEIESGANFEANNLTITNGVIRKEIILFLDEETTIVIPGNTETTQQGGAVNVQAGANAIFNNMIIANSVADLEGGAINNLGSLELNNTVVQNSQAGTVQVDGSANPTLGGGGIYNQGTLNISRSAILDNVFVRTGLDIDDDDDDILDDIFEGEVIEGGGAGILNEIGATLTVLNSTIAGNSSREEAGGGILSRGTTTIINSTITDNIAQLGAGFWGETTNSNNLLINTIIAGNRFGENVTVFNDQTFFNNQGEPLFFDGSGDPLFTTEDNTDFDFFNGEIFIQKSDPFAPNRRENITNQVSVDNLIFDGDGNLTFVFDSTDFDSDLEDGNLVFNENQNFAFAYVNNIGSEVYLDTFFDVDEQGETILVLSDPTVDINENFEENLFIADRSEEFTFTGNTGNPLTDNRLIVNEDNVNDVPYVYDQNGVQIRDQDIVEVDIIPFPSGDPRNTTPDIDGFFNPGSSNNLIGNTNGILDGTRDNIAGSSSSPLDPGLGERQTGEGITPYYPLLPDSPAINMGDTNFVQRTALFNNSVDENGNIIDQIGGLRISPESGAVDIGSIEFQQESDVSTNGEISNEAILDDPLFRFQNLKQQGTYLYAGQEESESIEEFYPDDFVNEGFAFNVSFTPEDDLIAMYRFQNLEKSGTYLYTTEGERDEVIANYGDVFRLEGLAFYVYGADADVGEDIFRLQNTSHPGTYLFVKEAEKNQILTNYSNYVNEGVAFEVS